jgi:hypothetical protein
VGKGVCAFKGPLAAQGSVTVENVFFFIFLLGALRHSSRAGGRAANYSQRSEAGGSTVANTWKKKQHINGIQVQTSQIGRTRTKRGKNVHGLSAHGPTEAKEAESVNSAKLFKESLRC